jgi:hypothetical protein
MIRFAVYILALRDVLAEQSIPAEAVSDEAILVCPGRGMHWNA